MVIHKVLDTASPLCYKEIDNTGHVFHLITNFCIKCGIAREQAFDKNIDCYATPNVIAISHIRCQQRLKGMFYAIRTTVKHNNTDT